MALKEQVLSALETKQGETVSGSVLAERLGVTRAAVSKAVRSLKSDGCVIEAKTNQGYRLISSPGVLDAERISSYLKKPVPVEVLQTVDSTNSEMKRRLIGGLSQEYLLTAEEQTGGRGRQGKSFYSPKGSGIYMTILLHPHVSVNAGVSVTTRVSVAVARAIRKVCHADVGIKWVNDVYLQEKKICGILVESVSDFESGIINSLVIGIGVNTTTADFPEEIRERAGSLTKGNLDRNRLIAEICNETMDVLRDFSDSGYLKEYREWSIVIGRDIDFTENGATFSGTVRSIDEEGRLVVQLPDGNLHVLSSGEISLRLKK